MPASHCTRDCTEAGVRKASKEESAGEFSPAVVSVYGNLTRCCEALVRFSDGDAGRVSGAREVLVGLGAVGRVVSRCGIWVFARAGGAEGCRRLSVGATGEISASDGSGDGRWRQGCDGHELSSPNDRTGHSLGWQPGPKVTMIIMRPPQHGQAFHSSCSRPSSAPSPLSLDGAGLGTPRS